MTSFRVVTRDGFAFHTPNPNLITQQEGISPTTIPDFFTAAPRIASVTNTVTGTIWTPPAVVAPVHKEPVPKPPMTNNTMTIVAPRQIAPSPPAPPLPPQVGGLAPPIGSPGPNINFIDRSRANLPPIQTNTSGGGQPMTMMLWRPGAAIVMRGAAQLTKLGSSQAIRIPGMGGLGGGGAAGGALRTALQFLGVETVLDLFGIGLLGGGDRDDADEMSRLIEEMVESGYIQTPGVRRDGTTGANNWLHWNIDDDDARPFLTSEYIGRSFVNAVRKNERTPRYSGRPRPRGRARRSS